MATYAVGDVQGCYRTLRRLVRQLEFDPAVDRLWLAGDLVNRGPRSLEVLRWVRDQGEAATCVLGNHDLHLLARAAGKARAKPRDTLDDVLAAPDRHELLMWLRQRPLLVQENGWVMIHAGLVPQWSVSEAVALAREAEGFLRGTGFPDLMAKVGHRGPARWDPRLQGLERVAAAVRILCTVRAVDQHGALVTGFHGPPADCPEGTRPWFDARSADGETTMVTGHWAAAGLVLRSNLVALDTGCVWGGALTAVCLEDRRIFQEPLADTVAST